MNSIPIPDQEITVIRTKATKGGNAAAALVIETDADMLKATDLLGNIKTALKAVTAKKKEITDPMTVALNKVRDLFKPIEGSLIEAEYKVKAKMLEYQKEVDRKAQEQMAAIEAKADAGSMSFAEATEAAIEIPTAQRSVESKKGTVTFKEVQVAVLVDETLVPREYLVVDEVKARKAVLAGVTVPGYELRTEKQVAGRY